MKNKIYYIMLCLISSFAFMNNVFAEGELSFSIGASVVGGETVVKGSEATVNVSLNSDTALSSCTFNIISDAGIEFVSKSSMNNYVVRDEGENIIVERANTDVNFVSGQNVLELKYKVNNDGKLTIKTINCKSAIDDKSGSTTDKVIEFKTKEVNDDTSLSILTVTGGTLSPKFSSNAYNYTVQLHDTKFSLNMTASNSDYQDDIVVTDADGKTLDARNIIFKNDGGQGIMAITITVNGKTKYELGVRYVQEELDNSLSSLKVGDQLVKLESGKYDYSVNVGKDVTEVKIEAFLKDSNNFKFVDGNGLTTLQIPSAVNSYALMIEPKDSSSGGKGVTYLITINREGLSIPSEKPSTGSSSNNNGTSNNNGNQGNATTNPSTGGISMFLMAFVLIASLIGSIYLYKKNLEGYN